MTFKAVWKAEKFWHSPRHSSMIPVYSHLQKGPTTLPFRQLGDKECDLCSIPLGTPQTQCFWS